MMRVPLLKLSEIPAGEGRTVEVRGRHLAVFHTRSGRVFATDARCPHRQGPLADGLLGDSSVVCPLHEKVFDLATGAESGGDCVVTTYPAHCDAAGEVVVELPE